MSIVNVIHLRDTEYSMGRLNSFVKEFHEQGVDFNVWDGILDVNRRRGINRAHKRIVQYAKDNNLPEICIAEDDIIFLGPGAFEYYLQNKPAQFSLYLGGVSDRIKVEGDYIVDFRGMTLYTIRQDFYDTFLSVKDDADIDAAMKGLGKYYLCPKVVCSQRAGYSYHKKRHTDYSGLLKQFEIYGANKNI